MNIRIEQAARRSLRLYNNYVLQHTEMQGSEYLLKGERMKQMFIALITLFSISGCSTSPEKLTNFEDQSMRRIDNRRLSIEEVQLDIRQAAANTGWEVEPGELPGHIKAIHKDEDKSKAIAEIIYDTNKYSITYKSSDKLGYVDSCKSSKSGSVDRNCIDPKYNAWVTELNEAISKELQD